MTKEKTMAENLLYYGDNLDVLQRYIPDESVDLVYLDPPFKSSQDYNVLFAERNGARAAAQIKAFEDTWQWDQIAEAAYIETVQMGGRLSDAMQAFRKILGESDMMAYLAMMAPRLAELRRVLKPTGSLYLHCDPTASHYLKLLLDAVMGAKSFRSEIVWKRSSAHSDTKQGRRQHGRLHDIILFYTRSEQWTWNPVYTPYSERHVDTFYRHADAETGRRYAKDNLTAARPGGDTRYEWRVKRRQGKEWRADLEDEWKKPKPGWEYKGMLPYGKRIWAYSRENMIAFEKSGRICYTSSGMPCYKRFLDEMPGVPLQDIWTDIPPLSPTATERLGYPTQKPEALLERIIQTSSNPGDIVLDPFCGCGTSIAAAHGLQRKWIGIDITHIAITLIKVRLRDTFGKACKFDVLGEPVSLPDAEALAAEDPYQFQWWALGLVGARPVEQKKGADKGIDGQLYFFDGDSSKAKQIVFSVKAGKTSVAHVRDLVGVLAREDAPIGALITLKKPTKPMRAEAASAGFYESPGWNKSFPRLQLLTIEELLKGHELQAPPSNITFKKAPKTKKQSLVNGKVPRQEELDL